MRDKYKNHKMLQSKSYSYVSPREVYSSGGKMHILHNDTFDNNDFYFWAITICGSNFASYHVENAKEVILGDVTCKKCLKKAT